MVDVVKYRCNECGAVFTSGSMAKSMHTKTTKHTSFKKEKVHYDVDHSVSWIHGKRL